MNEDILAAEKGGKTEKSEASFFDLNIFAVDFFKGLKKFFALIPILAVIGGCVMGVKCKRDFVPLYTASATFSVKTLSNELSSSGAANYTYYYNNQSAQQISLSLPYIVSSRIMTDRLHYILGSYINGSITASVVQDTNILTIKVTSTNANDATRVLNAVIKCFPEVAQYVIGNTSIHMHVKSSEPYTPINSPGYSVEIFKGAAAGLVAALAVMAVYAATRNTIRQRNDFKEKLNQDCIAEIPFIEEKRRTQKSSSIFRISDKKYPLFAESFRILRKRIFALFADSGKQVIAVTSAAAEEGKTTVALNLAHSIAKSGKRVVLVDMDYRSRTLQQLLSGADYTPFGVSELAQGKGEIHDAVHECSIHNLRVIFPGDDSEVPRTSDLEPIIRKLRHRFDYVVIDMPPCGVVADAARIASLSDGILFVARQDFTPTEKIKRALQYVIFSNASILGFVFNGVKAGFDGYGGYYSGDYKYGSYGRYGYNKYGYGKYGYSKYGYGKYGYGKYGYGKHGYGTDYGTGYGYGQPYGYGDKNAIEPDIDALQAGSGAPGGSGNEEH